MTVPVTERAAWRALQAHYAAFAKQHLRELFAADPRRAERFSLEACGIYLDYSKNRISDETLRLLVQLADECGLRGRIDAMFRGDKINVSENRAVLHVALRAPKGDVDRRRRRQRGAAGACGARRDECVCGSRAQRRVEGSHR